jgi:hypothetical protein
MQRVRSLAISPDGFVFDPTTGESFTVNATGRAILEGLRDGRPPGELPGLIAERFAVAAEEASRDVDDFLDNLRAFRLL